MELLEARPMLSADLSCMMGQKDLSLQLNPIDEFDIFRTIFFQKFLPGRFQTKWCRSTPHRICLDKKNSKLVPRYNIQNCAKGIWKTKRIFSAFSMKIQ